MSAPLRTERVLYEHDGLPLEGYAAYDPALPWPRPGVLVCHMWKGLVPFVEERTRALAALGFVAFALDLYGRGVRPQSNEEAAREMNRLVADIPLLRRRARAGLARLADSPLVRGCEVAALGYCFGGGVALELARDGADLAAAISFHGLLDTPRRAARGAVQARVLAFHGVLDPMVSAGHVQAFQREMEDAGADWQLVVYGRAGHGFTNYELPRDPRGGLFYEPDADRRSWAGATALLREALGDPAARGPRRRRRPQGRR
jgi:dienelactone hydrolase